MRHVIITLSIIISHVFCFAQQTINGSITHDGIQREYLLYIPAIYTASSSSPLIINYHGYGSNASEQMFYGDFRSIADSVGFIVVHPEGTLFGGLTHWNVGGWTGGSTVDDVGFTEALLDSLAAIYSIDATRVYATGMSNGGFMSFLLACQLSEKIAAIASVTGSMTPETYNNSNPQHPTPILQMHGTSDAVVPYIGASWTKSINEVIQYWTGFNNCYPTPDITMLPDLNPNDGSIVEHSLYSGGDNGVSVEHYKIMGGDHTWPGSAIYLPGTNYDINASVEIWKFFSKYDIDGFINQTSVNQTREDKFNLRVFPNPSNSIIKVEGDFSNPEKYEIFSQVGIKMIYGYVSSEYHQIDISHLQPNIYFLRIGNQSLKIVKTK